MLNLERSRAVFDAAQKIIPGGVNSPVRAYRSVGGTPVHMARGKGALVWDLDGNEYVDFVLSYGPLILGHADPRVVEAITKTAATGTAFGTPSQGELDIARMICERVAPCEMVRLVNSGTEATMSALRLARAFTKRDIVLKFDGNYHGHCDSFLVKAGSGALTHGTPDSPGVPKSLATMTVVAQYNDIESVRKLLEANRDQVACIIVEPVAGNVGLIQPAPGFLLGLRDLCTEHKALLIFDEVMTGFRVARGGYQELCKVSPDLITFGKVIGGGVPVGAYGGRADVMSRISPAGDVYQAGTLSGNPLAVAAGLATLRATDAPGFYAGLDTQSAKLAQGIESAAKKHGINCHVGRQGSMLCPYLSPIPVRTLAQAMASDREQWKRFFHALLENGVHVPPSQFEAWFVSSAHDDAVIERVIKAVDLSFAKVKN
ncbi:MAG: glutamate-1-semialdehyde 2,1-aminomutase [Planctomycetes bacterium]|nr:glutamate-1-semialdehyde 2,1-aminomutase [Planctomycetota bacterium]